MNLVVISQLFPPETAAGANRVGAIAEALRSRCTVRVVTLVPGYPEPDLYSREAWQSADRVRGIDIVRRPAFRPHDRSLARRALREIGMSLSLVRSVGGRPDVLLVSTPSMFLAPFAWIRARLSGARLVWDVRDLTWRYAMETAATGALERPLLRLLEAVMLFVLRRTDLVIAATAGLGEVLQEQGVPAARMITAPNGVARAFLDAFPDREPTPVAARPRVTYIGLMGYNHGIGILVEVARRMPEVDVHLVGDGPERAAIEAQARGLANLFLRGYVTGSDALIREYQASDVLVNHTRNTPILNRIVYPAKTFEYFATRRPVVYAGAGWAAEMFRSREVARVVPPDDPEALAAAIREVLADPAAARARSERARRMVEADFCREAQMDALAAEITGRLGSGRSR